MNNSVIASQPSAAIVGIWILSSVATVLVPAAFYQGDVAGVSIPDCTSTGVTCINPGQDAQAIINSKTAGGTFILKAGLHRMQYIRPRNGDTILGEPGTILNGSRILTGWQQVSGANQWKLEVSHVQGEVVPSSATWDGVPICPAKHNRCRHPEMIFFGERFLLHQNSQGEVGAGEFYIHYNSSSNKDTIYIGDDPTNQTVEQTVTPYAVESGSSQNVTVRNLTIEKYATPFQRQAIMLRGANNTVEYNEVRYGHGAGIQVGNRGIVRHNYIHHNGFSGIGGNGTDMLFENNEVSYNGTMELYPSWDGGGSKFALSTNLIVRNNYVHHNRGSGLWVDIDNVNTLIENNIVIGNWKHGIQEEISYSATIRNNYVADNGGDNNQGRGSQIYVQLSQDVTVTGNTVIMPPNPSQSGTLGIFVQNDFRQYPTDSHKNFLKNVIIRNNSIYSAKDALQYMVASGKDSTDKYGFVSAEPTILIEKNTYYVPNDTNQRWGWGKYWPRQSFASFQATCYNIDQTFAPQETDGRACAGQGDKVVKSGYTIPNPPAWNVERGPQGANAPIVRGPFGNTPANIPGRIEAENFDTGNNGDSYLDSTTNNEGNSTVRSGTAVDIKKSADGTNNIVGNFKNGEWLEYTVNIANKNIYTAIARTHSLYTDRKLTLTLKNTATAVELKVPVSPDWNTPQTGYRTGFELPAGEYILRVANNGADWIDLDYIDFKVVPPGCTADYDDSGTLDLADLSQFVRHYKTGGATVVDLQQFASQYRKQNACY